MWTPSRSSLGSQLLAHGEGRHRICTCHAKRYIPNNKQLKKTSGGAAKSGSSRRKPDAEPDAEELLRELNSGGAGWLQDEDEQDWGLDDIAEHAKVRKQRTLTAFPVGISSAPSSSSPLATATTAAPAVAVQSVRAGGGPAASRRRGAARQDEAHVSPLEAGVARVDEGGEGRGGVNGGTATGGNDVMLMMSTGEGGLYRSGMTAGKGSSTAVELEVSYARRNPEVVQALKLQGIAVRVRQQPTDEEVEGDDNTGTSRDLNGSPRVWDSDMYGDEDDDLGLSMDADLNLYEEAEEISTQGGRTGRGGVIGVGPAGKSDWYDSLSAAGFSARTSATGEVFLERTVRQQPRKTTSAARTASAADGVAAVSTSPPERSPSTTIPASATGGAVHPTDSHSASPSPPPPPPLVPPLDPLTCRPTMATALSSLTAPPQVLDFLELSFPRWAANGYRLADTRTGRPVPAPSPAEAAHGLHALALTARRSAIGGWRCMDLAAGRQAQGLAEALRTIPPRLLPEYATPSLSEAYFEAARRYWLEPRLDPVIGNPQGAEKTQERTRRNTVQGPAAATMGAAAPAAALRLGMTAPAAMLRLEMTAPVAAAPVAATTDDGNGTIGMAAPGVAAAASEGRPATLSDGASPMAGSSGDEGGEEGQPEKQEEEEELLRDTPGSRLYDDVPYGDPMYESLLAKYTAISERQQLLNKMRNGAVQQQPGSQQPGLYREGGGVLNGGMATAGSLQQDTITSSSGGSVGDGDSTAVAVTGHLRVAVQAPPASSSVGPSARVAAEGEGAAAAERRVAKIDSLVAALWAMSSLGGPPYFQSETEAVLSILVRCLGSSLSSSPSTSTPASSSPAGHSSGVLSGWQSGQVLWALGNARHGTPRLADLEAAMLRSGGLPAMCPRDVSRVLWGFASLGQTPELLLLSIRPDWGWKAPRTGSGAGGGGGAGGKGKGYSQGDVRSFTPQQLAVVVWSLAVMQQVDTLPFRCAWARLLSRASEVPRSEAVLTQIWQTNLAIALESAAATSSSSSSSSTMAPTPSPGTPAPIPLAATSSTSRATATSNSSSTTTTKRSPASSIITAPDDLTSVGLAVAASASLPSPSSPSYSSSAGGTPLDESAARSLLLRARSAFLEATSGLRRRVQSGYQRQIANGLTGLKMMHLIEDNREGYSIDITLPSLRIAIEADGPTHISRTPGGAVLGATAMKRRHLQRLGWQVMNITYKEWDKLTSESSRRAFLQERINQALLASMRSDGLQDDDNNEGEAGAMVAV